MHSHNPAASASPQPIGMAIQMPILPMTAVSLLSMKIPISDLAKPKTRAEITRLKTVLMRKASLVPLRMRSFLYSYLS